ncbi:hypothetical protein [Noviherbaspirillum aridicola]|uniref:Invasion protein IalB n=1 Tax=Noviherbaspirillum aridicola TaxID=2849687 RepID=A0ABQ4Q564_9BURK|nr:hypothetical protein [Noviherbaspirillum aridicola]GIZ52258.1 hypothetical protein NCCP691_22720 [Noviherbaspirillum aridicola]
MNVLRTIVPIFLLALAAPAPAQTGDYAGAWQAWLCPEGLQRDSGRCSTFVLELHQKEGRLCGSHMFSNADASRIDEGGAPSITGESGGETAEVVLTSTFGKTPVQIRGELKRVGSALQWQRLDAPRGDYLLPQKARLTKAKKKSLFAPVFEQELQAICLSAFTMAEQNAARQQQSQTAPAPAQQPSKE